MDEETKKLAKSYFLPFVLVSIAFYLVVFEGDSVQQFGYQAFRGGNSNVKTFLLRSHSQSSKKENELDAEDYGEASASNRPLDRFDYQHIPTMEAKEGVKAFLAISPRHYSRGHIAKERKERPVLSDSQFESIHRLMEYVKLDDFFLLGRCPTGEDAIEKKKTCSLPCECPKGWMGMDCSIKKPCPECSLPDVVMLGTQKGGTSNLVSAMSLHPSKYSGHRRNTVLKDKILLNRNPPKVSFDRYFNIFQKPLTNTQNFTVSGSAGYYSAWWVPGMLYALNPDFKFTIVYRNPVSRADSNIRMVLKVAPVDSVHYDRIGEATSTIDACLSTGRFLVNQLEIAMSTGVSADVNFRELVIPVKQQLFQRYNKNLSRLKELKELVTSRGVDFEDFLSFRLACNSLPQTEPMYSIYKSLYYYHLIAWFAMFPKDKKFLILPSELLFTSEQTVVDLLSDFIGIARNQFTEAELAEIKLNSNSVVTQIGWSEEQRQMLVEWFRPHNEKFFKLLEVRDPNSPHHLFHKYWKDFQNVTISV